MHETRPTMLERRLVRALVASVFLRGRRRRPPPPPAHPPSREVVLEGAHGSRLTARWFPAQRPRGVVVLAHPDTRWAKDWFVRQGWVAFAHEAGLDALAFDFVGYGGSHGVSYPHEDVLAATRLAREWSGMLPVHVVGVSYGAFAAANAAPHLTGVASLALESPYPNFNAWYPRGPQRVAIEAFDRAFPRSSRHAQADANLARAAPGRILVCLAEEDEVTPPALTEAVAARAPAPATTLLRVPGARHLEPFAKSREYRERLLRAWGVARAPAPPGPAADAA